MMTTHEENTSGAKSRRRGAAIAAGVLALTAGTAALVGGATGAQADPPRSPSRCCRSTQHSPTMFRCR